MHATVSKRYRGLHIKSEEGLLTNQRNLNTTQEDSFIQLCRWLCIDAQSETQFSMQDLQDQLETYLPTEVAPYSAKHLKRRLTEYFGEQISIAEIDGKANIVTLRAKAATIMHDSYHDIDSNEDDDGIEMAKLLGSVIRNELSQLEQPLDIYPTPGDVDVDKLAGETHKILQQLIATMFSEARSETARTKRKVLQLSVAHVIMQAAGNKSFISPLLLAVGLFIHQTTRSRLLIDVLSSLGRCVSYSQVMAFERSAVVSRSVEDSPPGLIQHGHNGGFCQWVADNFDYNEDTTTGHDTTHVMGVIACQTPCRTDQGATTVKRKLTSAAEIMKAGDFGQLIKPYKPNARGKMADVTFMQMKPVKVQTMLYELVDTLWLFSSLIQQSPPNWQGFMATIVKGVWDCTAIRFHPMIPLNPSTDEAV